jgi:hypothetical protein
MALPLEIFSDASAYLVISEMRSALHPPPLSRMGAKIGRFPDAVQREAVHR